VKMATLMMDSEGLDIRVRFQAERAGRCVCVCVRACVCVCVCVCV